MLRLNACSTTKRCDTGHYHLPALTGTLTELIPEPDEEFLDTSLEQVLPDVKRAGVSGLEEFTMAIQVVFLQLAASADVFASLSVDAGLEKDMRTLGLVHNPRQEDSDGECPDVD